MGRTLRNKLVYGKKTSKTILLFILFLAASISLLPGEALAQGTGLDIEDLSLTSGDTATLYLRLTEAIDGLGRLDATIVSNNPDVLQLREIAPEAVSEQFLQIDSQSNKEIKFKLVDLGKNIDPGDTNVQLVSFKVEAVQGGEAKIGLEGIKYTDEDGNVIKPEVSPSTVTVSVPVQEEESEEEAEEKKPIPSEETEATKEKKKPEKESKPEKEEKPQEREGVKTEEDRAETGEELADGKRDYELKLDGINLRLGAKEKLTLNISSLPDGFRLAETTVISQGVKVYDVTREKPLYYEVVDHSQDSIHFRVGDFDGEVRPDTSEFTLAELNLEALRVGWANLRVKSHIWTDDGKEVVRTTELTDIKVFKPTILGTDNRPQDMDGDGLYEDVDGDGELTEKDVFVLAVNLKSGSEGIDAPMVDVFDFNEDGVVNFDDVVELMKQIRENK